MRIVEEKRSFLEVLVNRKPKSRVEYFNPLGMSLSSIVSINLPGHEGVDYRVSEIEEWTRTLNGRDHVHAVYILLDGDDTEVHVWAMPLRKDGSDCVVAVLKVHHETVWNEEIGKSLDESLATNKWVVEDDGTDADGNKVSEPYRDEYERINEVPVAYEAFRSTLLSDGGGIISDTVTYYDFIRTVEDVPGAVSDELYIVVKEAKADQPGYLTMLKGDLVDSSRITVL